MAEVDFVLRDYGILSRDFKPIITLFFYSWPLQNPYPEPEISASPAPSKPYPRIRKFSYTSPQNPNPESENPASLAPTKP